MRRSGSGMPTRRNQSMARRRAASPRSEVCVVSVSMIWSPTRMTGFRLVEGSWKIMPMRPPRTPRIALSGRRFRSSPSRSICPPTMRPASGSSRSSASAVMLLPQPDSPTSAKVSRRATASPRRLTAWVMPRSPAMSISRSRTSSMGEPAFIAHLPGRPGIARGAGAASAPGPPRGWACSGACADRRRRAPRRRTGWPPAPGPA